MESVRTNDNVTYTYNPGSCWTLLSGHCGPTPYYAIFQKKVGNKLAVKAYFGGHVVDINEEGQVYINGEYRYLGDEREERYEDSPYSSSYLYFKILKLGKIIHVYSDRLRIWMATDGHFIQVMPDPFIRGQHCGICGNFNRNQYDEWMGKDGATIHKSADDAVNDWQWKC